MWGVIIIVVIILIIGVAIYQANQNKGTSVTINSSNANNRSSTVTKISHYSYDIVGEQAYQKNLEKIAGKKEEKSKRFECSARVISEPTNQYDKNAVKVEINGLLVSYLSKNEAVQLKGRNINKIVPALINGGWHDDRGQGSYGVKLAINNVNDLL